MSRRAKAVFALDPQWLHRVYDAAAQAELDRLVDWVAPPQSAASVKADPTVLRDVEVIFGGWGMPVLDAATLAAAPALRAVFHAGGTIRYFATPAFWARDITVTSGAAINAIPVAEYALATILFSLRHGWHYARGAQAHGAFPPRQPIPGSCGSTVGLISLGLVGRRTAALLRATDLRVIAFDPVADESAFAAAGAARASLDEVFARSDVVSLHAPLLPATEGMITGAHFAAMPPGATFINTARGAIVREAEMIAVLQARPDLTAVLDVTWPEPPAAGSPLYTLPNVVLTPHIAGSTDREVARLGRAMLDEFRRWQSGQPLEHGITADDFVRMA